MASSSTYRRQLLDRLGLAFSIVVPDIDESALQGESGVELSIRLAKEKAGKVAQSHPDALIIASDQVLVCDQQMLGKPGDFAHAKQQLMEMQGKTVTFYTSICLLNSANQQQQVDAIPIHVHFRELTQQEIERYLKADQPYDCAGSFKSESLGISLLNGMDCDDPTALVGLPLIRLTDMLKKQGVRLP